MKFDSIIFDMDGTLWDPTELYLQAWNSGLKTSGVDKVLTAEDLKPMMGVNGKTVLETLLPEQNAEGRQRIADAVNARRRELITSGGGTMYPGVKEGIKKLSEKYKLFIVSNCPKGIITLFMNRAGITDYIVDEMAYGFNLKPKNHNIKLLIKKHHLQSPIYVGDTDIDRVESEQAGVPFAFVSYGFAVAEKYDLSFDNFDSLVRHFS
ncbi:phosphoglycolate phosphatase [Arcticibacter pallidicorallinus]|uniref:phosphoglycolate phosphatase n=1 Tax=Arcticibacter pallidicorallinus TaxID=1259464 RepID=A0A2T0U3B6_9SPHI|nr:HAD family hydrolase [Arcticibacter pallidicorallinus]PRY52402.1 phosphoglycolate phosphatase [Arcticibacter pallidicorallinus]